MKLRLLLASLAFVGFSASATLAQDGEYGPSLKTIIEGAAAGKCDAELMAPSLLTACEGQIAQMSAGLASLGTVEALTLVSAEDSAQGRIETYVVKFSSGRSMNFVIGARSEGKFAVVGSRG